MIEQAKRDRIVEIINECIALINQHDGNTERRIRRALVSLREEVKYL